MANVTGGNSVTSSTQLNPDVVTANAIATDAVDTAEIKSGAVKTDEIFDGTIVNADISANAQIDITKIKDGTQGGVFYRGANGVLMELPAGTLDYYLATQGAGQNPIWKVLATPVNTLLSTCFETITRFTSTLYGDTTSASNTCGASGLAMHRHYTYGVTANGVTMQLVGKASTLYLGSPIFSLRATLTAMTNSVGSIYLGLGNPTVATTGHTFTVGHAGFKIIKTGGVISLYATQADGTTETASAALATLSAGDDLDLMLRINSTTSVDYWYRINGGAVSSATNLATNMPAGTSQTAQFSISCDNADNNVIDLIVKSATYTR